VTSVGDLCDWPLWVTSVGDLCDWPMWVTSVRDLRAVRALKHSFLCHETPEHPTWISSSQTWGRMWIRTLAAWIRTLAAWIRTLAAWIRTLAAWIRTLAAWIRTWVDERFHTNKTHQQPVFEELWIMSSRGRLGSKVTCVHCNFNLPCGSVWLVQSAGGWRNTVEFNEKGIKLKDQAAVQSQHQI